MKLSLLFFLLIFNLLTNSLFCQDLPEFQNRITEANQNKDTLAIARGWHKLGKFYEMNGQLKESTEAFRTALFFADCIKSFKAISSIANYLASNFDYSAQNDSALYYYKMALDASIEIDDSTRMPIILINIGDSYANMGQFVEAANHAINAIRIKELLNDSTDLAYYYQKVGEVYKTAGENEMWEEYIKKAYNLIFIEKCTDIKATSAIYNDLGGIAKNHGDYDQAVLYYDTLFSIGVDNDYTNAIGVSLSNCATVYFLQGDIEKAIKSALKAREYRSGNSYQNIYDYNLLAELFLAKNNRGEALKYAIKSVNNKSISTYPDERMRAYSILYKIEKLDSNYKDALFWNEKFKSLSDSIRDKEIRTQILDLEIGYQTEKKEHQIDLLTTENQLKNQRLRTGIVLIVVLVILILLILYILNIRKRQAKLRENDLQLQVLRSQMNPHFIFNVLGSIQNFMLKNDNKKASVFLSQFASLTRSTLNYSATETIPLADEINMLRNYLELERMRSNNKFDFQINFDEDLEIDFIKIPPMIIQPFVENSIKHGFKELDRKGLLILKITDKTDYIEFDIEDNGVGILEKTKNSKKHQSMAMIIFEKRRRLIQQKFNKDFNFELVNLKDTNSKATGVKIKIEIPVIEND